MGRMTREDWSSQLELWHSSAEEVPKKTQIIAPYIVRLHGPCPKGERAAVLALPVT